MPEQFIGIEVERREVIGKQARKHTAKRGMIPGVVYGGEREPVPIAVDSKSIIQILRSEKGQNSVLLFSLKGTDQQRHVMVKDIQIDPLTNTLIHADFKRVDMDKKIRVKVPIVFEGVSFGVKTQGGMVDMIMRDRIHVDLTPLKIGDHVKVGDLKVGEGIRITVEDHHLPVVVISAPKLEAVATTEAEAEIAAEPEVVGRGKKAEEGEGEAEGKGAGKADAKAKGKKE
jgi:large subunit ribosomal protein L25